MLLYMGHMKWADTFHLRQARKQAGMTPEELARKLQTRKPAISRIVNHADEHAAGLRQGKERKP